MALGNDSPCGSEIKERSRLYIFLRLSKPADVPRQGGVRRGSSPCSRLSAQFLNSLGDSLGGQVTGMKSNRLISVCRISPWISAVET